VAAKAKPDTFRDGNMKVVPRRDRCVTVLECRAGIGDAADWSTS
jgi:hypothetical protein